MTTAAFVHLGDLHLRQDRRQADRLRAFDQIIGEGSALPDLAAWLAPGDLFDARSAIEDRNALKERFKRMADRAPVVIAYGNHDAPGDLDIFGDLAARWPVYVVATPQVLSVPLATGQTAAIAVIPYPTEAGLVSRGVEASLIPQTARQALEAIFVHAGYQLQEARDRGEITLMIGHLNVEGSVSSTGQPAIGQEISIDAALLARLGDCPKLLNHIHKAQSVGGAHYAGSVCRLNFGEVEPKIFQIVEFEELSA